VTRWRAEAARAERGLLHRQDHRVKTLAALALVLCAVLVPEPRLWVLTIYLGALAVLFLLSRVPPGTALRRLARFGPFVAMAVVLLPFTRRGDGAATAVFHVRGFALVLYQAGLRAAAAVLLKSVTSAAAVVLLVSTTPFPLILRALEWMRMPRTLVSVISLLVRYLALLRGESAALMRAARSRGWEWGTLGRRVRAAGGIVGSLFLRTYERGERVHRAMLARGFDGSFPAAAERPLGPPEIAALAGFLAAVSAVLAAAALLR
jgi:cobalt/nickel transport system permease protein